MKLHTDKTPKWVEVIAIYPAIQVESYAYVNPFKEGGDPDMPDEITIRVSTKHNNQTFTETYVFRGMEYDIMKEVEMVKKLRSEIKKKILTLIT